MGTTNYLVALIKILFTGEGNDFINGDIGNDFLIGGSGNDNLYGGEGDDLLLEVL